MSDLSGPSMMDVPLDEWLLFNNARRHHHRTEVVSRLPTGEMHRYTYADLTSRALQLMNALDSLGIGVGERVATLAWNTHRHVEAYFAVPCGGRVLHTLNVRLSAEELAFVMNDADDRAVLVDPDFLPLLVQVAPLVPGLKYVVVLGATPDDLDGSALSVLAYEDLIADEPATYVQPRLDERSPSSLCYTSGTTGRPKGVVSTHRSTYLHAMGVSSGAGMSVGPSDVVLIMGIGGNLDMWDPLVPHLPGRELVMFDFPGTGNSGKSWLPLTMACNAWFVKKLLRVLGHSRVDVLGYSWGGVLAQHLAIQHPGSVDWSSPQPPTGSRLSRRGRWSVTAC
jgi:acyl-CoA synthetase (AMP-forming)/AMP-acid ligase II